MGISDIDPSGASRLTAGGHPEVLELEEMLCQAEHPRIAKIQIMLDAWRQAYADHLS